MLDALQRNPKSEVHSKSMEHILHTGHQDGMVYAIPLPTRARDWYCGLDAIERRSQSCGVYTLLCSLKNVCHAKMVISS